MLPPLLRIVAVSVADGESVAPTELLKRNFEELVTFGHALVDDRVLQHLGVSIAICPANGSAGRTLKVITGGRIAGRH